MSRYLRVLQAAAACFLAACGSSDTSSAPPKAAAPAPAPAVPPSITQFYATAPILSRGEKELLCYGVENAKTVFLSPPRQELSAAISRCVEVDPTATTTYTLTAEGAASPPATKQLTITLGPPHVKLVDVTVSALSVKAGDLVSICVHAQNAASIEIEPLHFRAHGKDEACATDSPRTTTTYVGTAVGADGGRDRQPVTVKVQ